MVSNSNQLRGAEFGRLARPEAGQDVHLAGRVEKCCRVLKAFFPAVMVPINQSRLPINKARLDVRDPLHREKHARNWFTRNRLDLVTDAGECCHLVWSLLCFSWLKQVRCLRVEIGRMVPLNVRMTRCPPAAVRRPVSVVGRTCPEYPTDAQDNQKPVRNVASSGQIGATGDRQRLHVQAEVVPSAENFGAN